MLKCNYLESRGGALTASEKTTLHALATFSAEELLTVLEVAKATGVNSVSEKTAGKAIKKLIEKRLAERPLGAKSGVRVTIAGRRLSEKLDPK